MLRLHEMHNQYGATDEFQKEVNWINNVHMNEGRCVLTYMWGDLFRRSNAKGSILHDKLGIARTPGSEMVLNRATGNLEKCARELCPYAIYHEDIGLVNSAPYAANGGWGAAISGNTSPEKQKALADFFLWAASRDQSDQYVIPKSTLPWYEINGQDPWRKSQLDVDKWVAQGFDRDLSKQYVESILTNLVSKNVAVEAQFPKAGEIMSVLDKVLHDYLLGDTIAPILEIYQRLRGVFVPNEEKNHLGGVRYIGMALMVIILWSSMGAAVWIIVLRNEMVVKVSQPLFLGLICLGTYHGLQYHLYGN
ncbi:unnamed protein product [Cylindrotheca closterium]|uniref:Extracellular solute-binding protein n=1 Tax=Cylindrotheca closterium TaxID=2856 RepID=A0AAD2FZ59_9STRA|nr:unnamed protein product [Cylindrotheca closterium]